MTAFQPEYVDQFRFTSSGERVSDLTYPERQAYTRQRAASSPAPQEPEESEEVTEP